MTFLAPTALLGVLLLAIPIVVHLFKPRKTRVVPFSSLRWLRPTHQRLSRRIRWHQWLLFLMRAGVLLLLVLALAKPVWTGGVGSRGDQSRGDQIVIVDVGRDMTGGWESAQQAALALLKEPGRRRAVILADHRARLAQGFSADTSSATTIIESARPGVTNTNFNDALTLAENLASATEHGPDLALITNNPESAWTLAAVRSLALSEKAPPRVRVVEIPSNRAANAGIVSARYLPGEMGKSRILVELAASGAEEQKRTLRIGGVAGLEDALQEVTIPVRSMARVLVPLPDNGPRDGQVARLTLAPGDTAAEDDAFLVPLTAPPTRHVLLLEPGSLGGDGRPVGLFLRAALETLQAAGLAAMDLHARTPATAGIEDVRRADVIVTAGALNISEALRDAIETRVRTGAGLALWLGPHLSADSFRRLWHRPLQPAEGLVPFAVQPEAAPYRPDRPSSLGAIHGSHPLLLGLRDPTLGEDLRGEFFRYARFEEAPTQKPGVLARFADDTPALFEHPLGAGRVLIFNTSANDDWSDFPRRQGFVPLLDRTLAYLGQGHARRSFDVGEPVVLELPDWPDDPRVETAEGAAPSLRIQRGKGRLRVHLGERLAPGVYRIVSDGPPARSTTFVVNAGFRDKDVPTMDAKTLQSWWAPATVELVSTDELVMSQASVAGGRLWPMLVVVAGLLLIVETLYASWSCPRRQPSQAAPLTSLAPGLKGK